VSRATKREMATIESDG